MKNRKLVKWVLGMPLSAFIFICTFSKCKQKMPEYEPVVEIRLDTVVTGLNQDFVWSQAFATAYGEDKGQYLVTMSKQYTVGSDNYGDLSYSISKDGKSWTAPSVVKTLLNPNKSVRFDSIFSDVYPMLHEKTKKVLGTGKIFFYDRQQMPDPEIGRGTGYITYDPKTSSWSSMNILSFPPTTIDGDSIYRSSAGCSQRFDLKNGEILLPIMYEKEWVGNDERNASFVARCQFDGEQLTVMEVGNSITMDSGRGIYEPSMTKYENTYYLTLRTDHSAFVATSKDGLTYGKPIEWKFSDGRVLGSYNTQQHWISNTHGLYLVYTRKGAENDHVFRHRAPLFMAKVDPASLTVMPETEKIVVPERGARLGNFSVYSIDNNHAIVATAERIDTKETRDVEKLVGLKEKGYNNTLFLSMIKFK